MDSFDADVLIYAAVPGHPLGRRVVGLFAGELGVPPGIGSTLLLPEILTKPLREEAETELLALIAILGKLELRPLDEASARLAVALGAAHRLGAGDAVHLATAVGAGADRFITNNRSDFPQTIAEIAITYPDELPEAA
jgi:predicted nucleic acid-binding protein